MSKPTPARSTAPYTPARGGAAGNAPQKAGWLRSLLTQNVKLERRGLNVHVVLEPAAAQDTTAPGSSAGEALRRAHTELRALLDRHPDTRHLMRHLAYVERAIARNGSRAFRQVPPPVLERALEQLDLVLRGEQAHAITPLRERLERATKERPASAPHESAVDVSEASHSLFDEMEKSWTGQMPFEKTQPMNSRL
jgi:hypothetical protein